MKEKKGGPNGFLLGLLIGGAVGALISTKRGRQILKDVADYGLDYVGKTINFDDIEAILDEEEEEMMSGEVESARNHMEDRNVDIPKMSMEKKEEPARKRLFRGIRKK